MASELRHCQYLCHYVSQLARGVDVCEVHNILAAPVSNDVMLDVDMLGPLRSDVVRGHANGGLVVFAKEDRLMQFHAEFVQA